MSLLRPPAATDDFTHATVPGLAEAYDTFFNQLVTRATGSVPPENFYRPLDPPAGAALATDFVDWGGFPAGLDRWYTNQAAPTAAKSAQAEATAEVLRPFTYIWFQNGSKPSAARVELDQAGTLAPELRDVVRPLRVGETPAAATELVLQYRQQDEYLEWRAERDGGGLSRVVFTAEPPEYFRFLAEHDRGLLLKLYRDWVDPRVEPEDLFFQADVWCFGVNLATKQRGWAVVEQRDTYNEHNRWNTTDGIMHLTHPANTLGAEVNLAAVASRAWQGEAFPAPDPRQGLSPAQRRIACGRYGDINRNSDPSIGAKVGEVVESGARVTLLDPVGLYIAGADLSGISGPQGEVVGDAAWRVLRGNADPAEPRILRAEVRVPAGQTFGLGECEIDGRRVETGGQLARHVTMRIYAQAAADRPDLTPPDCRGRPCIDPQRHELVTAVSTGERCEEVDWAALAPLEPAGDTPLDSLKAIVSSGVTAMADTVSGLVRGGDDETDAVVDAELPAVGPALTRAV